MSEEKVISRTVGESQAERSEIIFPADSNALGNLFGGRLMQFIDLVGAVAAVRHCAGDCGVGVDGSSGFCGAGAYRRSADSKGEREPGVPDQHGGWRSGDGGGCAGGDAAACVVGVRDVCCGRSRGQAGYGSLRDSGDGASEAAVRGCGAAERDAVGGVQAGARYESVAGGWMARLNARRWNRRSGR